MTHCGCHSRTPLAGFTPGRLTGCPTTTLGHDMQRYPTICQSFSGSTLSETPQQYPLTILWYLHGNTVLPICCLCVEQAAHTESHSFRAAECHPVGTGCNRGRAMSNKRNQTADPNQPLVYQIRIKGHLGSQWADWFGGAAITLGRQRRHAFDLPRGRSGRPARIAQEGARFGECSWCRSIASNQVRRMTLRRQPVVGPAAYR